MPIILGRPLLATSHATVDIFRKSISLEVGNEKVVFKMKSSLTTNFESVCSIRREEFLGDDDSKKINDDLFLYETCEFNQLLSIEPDIFSYKIDVHESYDEAVCKISEVEYTRVHWCKHILQVKENIYQYWASYDPNSNICDEGDVPINEDTHRILKDHWKDRFGDEEDSEENSEDPVECEEDRNNAILGSIHDKLDDDWFRGMSEDEDDLDGIIDYLEPSSYNGFIGLDNEAYKKRKCKLLGITYKEPSPILIEQFKIVRYTLGLEEIYTQVKVLGVKEMPRTQDNIAALRARLMEKAAKEGDGQ
ncbi:hypothetical protein Tco_1464665 [Tanacetum coccineum]